MTERDAPISGAQPPRVVVTGIGAVSAWGWGAEALWRGLSSGRPAIGAPTHFDTAGQRTDVAAEVPRACGESGTTSVAGRSSRADQFAVAAASEAWQQANRHRQAIPGPTGVFLGGSTAGMPECEAFFESFHRSGFRAVDLHLLSSQQLHNPGDQIARELSLTGPVETLSSACASGALAISAAIEAVRTGLVSSALAGGADVLCNLTYSGFNALRAVDAQPCRPFRADRGGLSLGEGAAILHIETLETAIGRGAVPLVELLGSGVTCDAHHMTAPHPEGAGAAAAIQLALQDASVGANEVSFINCHGTGTPQNDRSEWAAIHSVFGERARELPATSTKSSVGHLLGSSGAIEAVATAQCLINRMVHVTSGSDPADEDLGIDLVIQSPRRLEPCGSDTPLIAISTSFGFGGSNAALVMSEI